MGSVGNTQVTPTRSLEELKAERKQLAQEYLDFVKTHADEEGVIENEADINRLQQMQTNLNEVEYDLYNQMSPVVNKPENWKGNNITDLTREEAGTVRSDMLKNRDMYLSISSAARGVFYGNSTADTSVDELYKSNPDKVYKIFEPTRNMLRKKYGDTITLYRVPTSATSKTTINMTSTKANAQQYANIYGGKVQSVKVPVKDVLAVNITRNGSYEEFIVLNRRK